VIESHCSPAMQHAICRCADEFIPTTQATSGATRNPEATAATTRHRAKRRTL
jgi:hypothetical protein